jgi:hypothetical protein
MRAEQESGGAQVATADDLAGYGFARDDEDERAGGTRSRPR